MANLKVHKKILSNGLCVLSIPQFRIPKVAIQLWYGVGSKNEKTDQKGIAHLIEHMIFKGTKTLSESDINLIVHKLSGSCNAFTSHDYTGYLFDMPVEHWQCALPIMADCMRNCTFKEDLLNSELKAVIQELKMYNDDYSSTLLEKLLSAIFNDHPYHYPVIGYKHDLWNLSREALVAFYEHHYVPNNAHLVVVGPVDPETVFKYAEENFGSIRPNPEYKRPEFFHSHDLSRQAVTIYRDIQQPQAFIAWEVPGARDKVDYVLDVLSWLLGSGRGSRLYQRIVEQEGLATDLESTTYDLIEHGVFIVSFQPKRVEDIERINAIVLEEIEKIVVDGFSQKELMRASKKTEMDFVSAIEDQERCAYLIGKYFLAHGDENYLSHYMDYPQEKLQDDVHAFIAKYFRPALMHTGSVLPIPENEKKTWKDLQEQSDLEDARVLSRITRETELEGGCAVHGIQTCRHEPFNFPRAERFTLANGLTVLHYQSSLCPKIETMLTLKARGYYDPEDQQGLLLFLADMMQEGTIKYPRQQFAIELESLGMSLSALPGQINMSMLSADAHRGFELLADMVTNALFDEKAIEKIREQILSDISEFWDAPGQFVGQLARDAVYGKHPYHKSYFGTRESIGSITRECLVRAYKKYITPQEAVLVVVGDLERYDIKKLVEESLGSWSGPVVEDIVFPSLEPIQESLITYPINRDQMVLAFAGLSIDRLNKDFDKLLLFDQILTGGALGSMSSSLFKIREQTGLFYTAGGSLLAGAHLQPGMMFIRAIVSPDKITQAERLIAAVIDHGAVDVTIEEIDEAKRAVTGALIDNFSTHRSTAASLLFLETFKLPADFFDTRIVQLEHITLEEVQEAVSRLVHTKNMARIHIGRVEE